MKAADWHGPLAGIPPQCRVVALTLSPNGNTCVLKEGHTGDHATWSGTRFSRCVPPRGDHHAEMVNLLRCIAHPRYQARSKPRTPCEGCWRLWALTHPDIELETRWCLR